MKHDTTQLTNARKLGCEDSNNPERECLPYVGSLGSSYVTPAFMETGEGVGI